MLSKILDDQSPDFGDGENWCVILWIARLDFSGNPRSFDPRVIGVGTEETSANEVTGGISGYILFCGIVQLMASGMALLRHRSGGRGASGVEHGASSSFA